MYGKKYKLMDGKNLWQFIAYRKWKNIVFFNDVKCKIQEKFETQIKVAARREKQREREKEKIPAIFYILQKEKFFLSIFFNKMWNSEINEKEFKTQIDSGKNSRYFLSLEKKKKMKKLFFS